jgi:hypothetical protein
MLTATRQRLTLRPAADWPGRAVVAVDLARVWAVIDRIAADVDELARARRAGDLDTAAVLPDRRAERRRRLAEPDLEFRAFCTRRRLPASSTPQLERAWDAWHAERSWRGEIDQRPGYTSNPFRPRLRPFPCHSAYQGSSGNWTLERCWRARCYRHF